jgi:hypothetical protein
MSQKSITNNIAEQCDSSDWNPLHHAIDNVRFQSKVDKEKYFAIFKLLCKHFDVNAIAKHKQQTKGRRYNKVTALDLAFSTLTVQGMLTGPRL